MSPSNQVRFSMSSCCLRNDFYMKSWGHVYITLFIFCVGVRIIIEFHLCVCVCVCLCVCFFLLLFYVNVKLQLVTLDGSLYVATPVDPLFVLLPLLERARKKVNYTM